MIFLIKENNYMSEEVEKVEEVKKSKILPKIFGNKDDKVNIDITGYYDNSIGEMILCIPKELDSG